MRLPGIKMWRRLRQGFDPRTSVRLLVLLVMLVALVASLGRVIANARNNYEVYEYEQQVLQALQAERNKLEQELSYYESYEYKKLYAQDYLGLAEPGARLYRILEPQQLYDVKERLYKYPEQEFSEWWLTALPRF